MDIGPYVVIFLGSVGCPSIPAAALLATQWVDTVSWAVWASGRAPGL